MLMSGGSLPDNHVHIAGMIFKGKKSRTGCRAGGLSACNAAEYVYNRFIGFVY